MRIHSCGLTLTTDRWLFRLTIVVLDHMRVKVTRTIASSEQFCIGKSPYSAVRISRYCERGNTGTGFRRVAVSHMLRKNS